jgi:hypothetical protein
MNKDPQTPPVWAIAVGLSNLTLRANLNNFLGISGQLAECEEGHLYYSITPDQLGTCPVCGREPRYNPPRSLLLPRHGFSTAAWDPPKLSTDVERVGSVERATITFSTTPREGVTVRDVAEFGGVYGLRARYREDGELLVYNLGERQRDGRQFGFAICTACGYADSEVRSGTGNQNLPSGFERHPRLTDTNRRSRCCRDGQPPTVLRQQALAARETTDVLLLDFMACLQGRADDEALIRTLAQALQIAGARLLELDTRELGVLLVPTGGGHGAVLYDNVPGGAGHVYELLDQGRPWLLEALRTLWIDEDHHARCETACLDCLLTFDAQEAMRRGLLNRRLVHRVLDGLLS